MAVMKEKLGQSPDQKLVTVPHFRSAMACYPGSELNVSQLLYALEHKLGALSGPSVRGNFRREELISLEVTAVRVLAGLRSFRNAHCFINRLLPETLALVFRYIANECHVGSSRDEHFSPYGWISVTHVCRYWYDTALSFPSIWSIIDSTCPAMAQVCIIRSKSATLDVRLSAGCSDGFLRTLQPHISRCKTLQSRLVAEEQNRMFQYLSETSAPVLRHVSITIPRLSSGHAIPIINSESIQHLRLWGCVLSQSIRNLTNLVNLDLVCDPRRALTAAALLDILERNPWLERVKVRDTAPGHGAAETMNRLVHLPYLQSLTMVNCASQDVLEHLALPRGAQLWITGTRPGSFAQNLPSSVAHLENITDLHILQLTPRALHAVGSSGSVLIDASVNEVAFGTLPISRIRELWFGPGAFARGFSLGPQAFWRSLGALETLVFRYCAGTARLLDALQTVDGKCLLPCLRNVTIYDDPELQPLDLIKFLHARKSRGIPLERLTVIHHPDRASSAKQVMSLKEHVQVVKCEMDDEAPKWPFDVRDGISGIFGSERGAYKSRVLGFDSYT